MGRPDSRFLPDHIRSENANIIKAKFSFEEIKSKYLDSLNSEQLRSIDIFLQDMLNSHVDEKATEAEQNFYNNEWKTYLNRQL